MLKLDITERSV